MDAATQVLMFSGAVLGTVGNYAGPGDVTTFLHWYGLRAYKKAYATGTNPAIDLVDQAGANQVTINILKSGSLDIASITAWVTAHSVTTIKVKKWYDQIGSQHVSQATLANMPVLVLNALGALASILFTQSASQRLTGAGSGTLNQPNSISLVANRTVPATNNFAFGDNGQYGLGYTGSADELFGYANTSKFLSPVTDGSFHAIQMVANGASGNLYVDGTAHTLNFGSTAMDLGAIWIGTDAFGSYMNGYISEVGVANSAFSLVAGGIASQINANQNAYYGLSAGFSGISKIVPNDFAVGNGNPYTNYYRREAEAPFRRVRLCIYSLEPNAGTGFKAVIAPTETPLHDTQARRYTPISGGLSKNSLQNAGNPDGWRTVTWGGSSSGTVPAAVGTNSPSVLRSDWIPVKSLPRTDGSLRRYLLARVFHANAAVGDTASAIQGDSSTGLGTWNTALGTVDYYREFWSTQGAWGTDGVGTLTNMPSTDYDSNWPYAVEFEFDYGVPTRTIACVGDSTFAAGGYQPFDYGQWLVQACMSKSTPANPIHAFNYAKSSQPDSVFMSYVQDLITAGVKFTDLVVPLGSPNDTQSDAQTTQNIAAVMSALTLCDSIGARLFIATRLPNGFYNSGNDEDQRLAQNTWARNYCAANPTRATLVDFDSVTSDGAYPARWKVPYAGDTIHPDAAAITRMRNLFLSVI